MVCACVCVRVVAMVMVVRMCVWAVVLVVGGWAGEGGGGSITYWGRIHTHVVQRRFQSWHVCAGSMSYVRS